MDVIAQEVGLAYVLIVPSMQGFSGAVSKEMAKSGSGIEGAAGNAGTRAGSKFSENAKKAAGAGMAAAGAAVAGFAAKSSASFAGFQTQMLEVFTLLPGITKSEMGKMTDDVKSFAKEFGVLPDKVVPALYQAISAGVPSNNVFSFLETAQKAAKGGVTDLETAVDGISSVVNAYGSDVVDAAKASDLMFTAVKLGKTNFEQLSSSLFNVVPAAAAAGVKFEEVTAGIAALTAQGTPTSVATTQMRQAIVELTQGAGKGAQAFKEISGKTFPQFIKSGGTLQQALQMMEKDAKANGASLLDMFGSVEAGQAALALTGKGTEKFNASLAEMQNATGATDTAFETMNSGISAKVDKLRAKIAVFSLDVGERIQAIGPQWIGLGLTMAGKSTLLTTAFSTVGGAAGKMASNVAVGVGKATVAAAKWVATTTAAAAKATASFVAAAARQAAAWAMLAARSLAAAARVAAAWLISMGPIAIVAAAVAGLTVVVVKNWDKIKAVITGAATAVLNFFRNNWKKILVLMTGPVGLAVAAIVKNWGRIKSTAAAALNAVKSAFNTFVGFVGKIPGRIGSALSSVANRMVAPFRSAFNAIRDLWNSTVGGFGVNIPSVGIGPFKTPGVSFSIPRMHTGGIVPGTGDQLTMLKGGEGVFTQDQLRVLGASMGSGGGTGTVIRLDPNGADRRLVELLRYMVRVEAGGDAQAFFGQRA